MSNHFEELESLLFDWESGALDELGVERMRGILRADPEARRHFIQLRMITAAMQLEADAGLGSPLAGGAFARPESVSPVTVPVRRVFKTSFWIATALSLLVCILSAWIVYSQLQDDTRFPNDIGTSPQLTEMGDPNGRDTSREATSRGVALVTRLVDVDWGVDQPTFEVGEALPPGRFAIAAGHAQVEFFCGATVIVEGPAELELASATLARVRSGRLRAHVPPAARGFSLEVDGMKVVDLGTEFALSVSPDAANIQVFDGEVELHQPAQEKRLVTAGHAVVRTAEGYQDAQITPEGFVGIAALESRAQLQRSARYERWQAWSDELRRDHRLIAYYAFDQTGDWGRRLASSKEPMNHELDGAIVGTRETEGRWDAKRALEFKQPADRVRVQIPGEYSSLTLACWVKIDSLDRWYNSLFLTDGYDQGEPHWQILDTGQLFFSVRVKTDFDGGPEHRKVLSPAFWTPSLSGKWLYLATTYDVEAKRVTHYLNGELLHQETIPDLQLVRTTRFGRATIGNWSSPQRPDAKFAIRNLNGSLDEFALFSAALSGEEIKEMYDHGKP